MDVFGNQKWDIIMQQQESEFQPSEIKQRPLHHDPLDKFIRFVLVRAATIYILVNITLLIWLVQTVLSSNLNSIQRSIYLIMPLLSQEPIYDIKFTGERCESQYQKQTLKWLPTIKDIGRMRANLSEWRYQSEHFCVKRLKTQSNNKNCSLGQQYCNGYCVFNKSNCPITNIQKFKNKQDIHGQFTEFYSSVDQNIYYGFSREEGRPIVGLMAAFTPLCANDYRYIDEYESFQHYLDDVYNCGKEGTLDELFVQFDQMPTKKFFTANNINNIQIKDRGKMVLLGFVPKIPFNTKIDPKCSLTEIKTKQSRYLFMTVSPSFSHTLLISCFVLFAASWSWLIVFYCCEGMLRQKNLIAVLMGVIELIIISYIFYENKAIFQSDEFLNKIKGCIGNSIKFSDQWNFGIESPSSFLTLIYVNIVFITMMFLSFLTDRFIYVSQ